MKRLLPLALALTLTLTGCGVSTAETPAPSETPTATPAPTPTGGLVYTDYSQLTPYEKTERPVAKFTRHYENFTDTLIPAEDYGPLIPFPGAIITRSAEDSWGGWLEDYDLYGLMTLEGEVVVDPVFSSAYAPSYWDELSRQTKELDCLVLKKVVLDGNGKPMDVSAVCARDGSWCTGFDYVYDWEVLMDGLTDDALPLLRRAPGESDAYDALVFLDPNTGETLKTVDLRELSLRWPDLVWSCLYSLGYHERYVLFASEHSHYIFDAETGSVRPVEENLGIDPNAFAAGSFSEGLCPARNALGWGYLDGNGTWAIQPAYGSAQSFQDGYALVMDTTKSWRNAYIDRTGKVIYAFPDGADSIYREGEFIRYVLNGRTHFLDKDLKPLSLPEDFTTPRLEGNWFYQELPEVSPTVPGGWAFWNYKTGARWNSPGDWKYDYDLTEDHAVFHSLADANDYSLVDLNTGEAIPLGRWNSVFFVHDGLTKEPYLYLSGMDDPSIIEWRTLNGDTLYRTNSPQSWRASFWDGKVFNAGENAATLTDLATGELIFSWPLRSMED